MKECIKDCNSCRFLEKCPACKFFKMALSCERRRLELGLGPCFDCSYIKACEGREAAESTLERETLFIILEKGPQSIASLAKSLNISRAKVKKLVETISELEIVNADRLGERSEIRLKGGE